MEKKSVRCCGIQNRPMPPLRERTGPLAFFSTSAPHYSPLSRSLEQATVTVKRFFDSPQSEMSS